MGRHKKLTYGIEKPKDFIRERKISELDIVLPKPPDAHDIANCNLPKEEQYWRRDAQPKGFRDLTKEEQGRFIRTQINRMQEGYWFYNNGMIENITGCHYFFLNWWKLGSFYPDFRDGNQDFFHAWKYVEDHPYLQGMIYMTNRRDGKSERSGSIVYNHTATHRFCHSGIQSMTLKDARHVFKMIVRAWRLLPGWMRPVDSGENNPQTALKFTEPSKKRSADKITAKVLESYIDYSSSVATAYDGNRLERVYLDEVSKMIGVDIMELWDVVKICLMEGHDVIGKAILTTTVEFMEKGPGESFKKLWDLSDPKQVDDRGKTSSGLVRIFKPACIAFQGTVDKYGKSNKELARAEIEKERAILSGDQLRAYKRKFPFTPEEAFATMNKDCPFDIDNINLQMDYNVGRVEKSLVRGNLVWDIPGKTVKWVPNTENGRWLIYKHPKPSRANQWTDINGLMQPSNTLDYISGCDPVENTFHTDGRRSDAASHVFRRWDPEETDSYFFTSEYVARPQPIEVFFEDMIKQSIYFGCKILIESNKIGLINYFRDKGYQGYLMKRPKNSHTKFSATFQKEYGLPTQGQQIRAYMMEVLSTYSSTHMGAKAIDNDDFWICPFQGLLDDMARFESDNWTDYDRTVSAMVTLVADASMSAVKLSNRKMDSREDNSPPDFTGFHPMYKNGKRVN